MAGTGRTRITGGIRAGQGTNGHGGTNKKDREPFQRRSADYSALRLYHAGNPASRFLFQTAFDAEQKPENLELLFIHEPRICCGAAGKNDSNSAWNV